MSEDEQETPSKRKRKQQGSSEHENEKPKGTVKKLKKTAKKTAPGKTLSQTAKNPGDGDEEDVVQDFQFSSDED